MDAHDIPEAIEWHEGLLLTPQHFQQLSLRHETMLEYVSAGIAPFGWGVRRLTVDQASLVGGMLRVIELEAVMPDSLVVSCGPRRGGELTLDLTQNVELTKSGEPVAVHLVVAARDDDAVTRGEQPRYVSVGGEPVPDTTTGEGLMMIPRLRPRLSLLVDNAPPKKFVALPLFKVLYADESYSLTDFIPPTLAVTRESPLGLMCATVTRRLRERASSLADQLRDPSAGARGGLDFATENVLRSLIAPLPALEGILATGASHPYAVYLALLSALGHLSLLGRSPLPPVLPAYNHYDLRATFERVLEEIALKVREGVTSSFTPYTFRREDEVFSLMFEGAWASRRLALGMRAQPGMTEQEMAHWTRECLIGSRNRMPWMRQTRILGARRELAKADEFFVPPRGVVLFSLKPDPDYIEPNEFLQIFNAGERGRSGRPAEIVLYVSNEVRQRDAQPQGI